MTLLPLPQALENCFDKKSLIYESDSIIYYNTEFDKELLKDIIDHEFMIYNGTYRHNYERDYTDLLFVGRGRNCGKKVFKVQNFYPYCWIESEEDTHKSFMGKPLERLIFYAEPKIVSKYRDNCLRTCKPVPYEADVTFVSRFLIDTYDFFKPKDYIEPKIGILDIETNFPVNSNIISFALNGYDNYFYYNSYFSEDNKYKLILDLYTQILQYDIITNWNVDFDIVETLKPKIDFLRDFMTLLEERKSILREDYIREITIKLQLISQEGFELVISALTEYGFIKEENGYIYLLKSIDTDLEFVLSPLDLKDISKKMHGREIQGRWSLDNAGKILCGINKVEIEGKKYPREFSEDELFAYNTRDCVIPEIIDNYLGGTLCHIILAWSLQSIIRDTLVTAILNDIALLRAYHKEGVVLNSRAYNVEEDDETYLAAEPDAIPGVYLDENELDLHAAYPSAVIAINSACETKDPNGKYIAPNGIRFNDKYSIFIKTLKELLIERDTVKTKMNTIPKDDPEYKKYKSIDFALKTQVAAFSHGIFGWKSSRMRDLEVADAITATVRELLNFITIELGKLGYQWNYKHTDSIYFSAPKGKGKEISEILNKQISIYCDNKGYSIIPHLDYKGYHPKAYIHSAARNVLVDEQGNWEPTGMNYDRSEYPTPLAEIEKNLIKLKLDFKSNEEIIQILKDMVLNLKNISTRELGIIKPLTKKISKYGKTKDGILIGLPYHIKAIQLAEDEYGFTVKVGEKFQVIPIFTEEFEGVRVKRRKRVFMAYPLEEELPKPYKVDMENYLRSNLWGKICTIFGDIKAKDLEMLVMDDHLRSELFV